MSMRVQVRIMGTVSPSPHVRALGSPGTQDLRRQDGPGGLSAMATVFFYAVAYRSHY